MSITNRRKTPVVIERLKQDPNLFSFQQAIRLLERKTMLMDKETMAKNPAGIFTPPDSELLYFNSKSSLAFPETEVDTIKLIENPSQKQQWQMTITFLGLFGTMGVLPYHYTELILQRLRAKDFSMQHFLNLFNHRTISLFHRATCKYSVSLQYERNRRYKHLPSQKDWHTQSLLSVIGLGTDNLTTQLQTKAESLIYYCGLFNQSVRTAIGLKQILQRHFEIPVHIREFIGQWQPLIEVVRTRLPGKHKPGCNNILGKSAMAGNKGWFTQGKFQIIIGPLEPITLKRFAPGTKTLSALNEIVRLYVGIEYDYDFIIRAEKDKLPPRVPLNRSDPPILGWNGWLHRPKKTGKMLDIIVSSKRLN